MPCLSVDLSAFTVLSGVKTHLKNKQLNTCSTVYILCLLFAKVKRFFKKIIIFRQIFNQEKTQCSDCTLLNPVCFASSVVQIFPLHCALQMLAPCIAKIFEYYKTICTTVMVWRKVDNPSVVANGRLVAVTVK